MCNTLNIKALELYCNIKKWNIELDTLINVDESFAVISLYLFLYFFNKLRKMGKERIENLMNK